jgi:hypothetical protein
MASQLRVHQVPMGQCLGLYNALPLSKLHHASSRTTHSFSSFSPRFRYEYVPFGDIEGCSFGCIFVTHVSRGKDLLNLGSDFLHRPPPRYASQAEEES